MLTLHLILNGLLLPNIHFIFLLLNMFNHEVILHPYFYISYFSKSKFQKTLLFIHGGPGFNSGTLEYLIKNENLFSSANFNLILYDQRNCGKSKTTTANVSHQQNLQDLLNIIEFLEKSDIRIDAFIGHSYGAKLLYDMYCSSKFKFPGIFVGIANSMLIPRVNNFLLDLNYLKKTNPNEYIKIFNTLNSELTLDQLWALTEQLSPMFTKNEDRPFIMWANLDWMLKIAKIQTDINLPINQIVLVSVRKDIYANQIYSQVDISSLNIPFLWINGFHDYIMNGEQNLFKK